MHIINTRHNQHHAPWLPSIQWTNGVLEADLSENVRFSSILQCPQLPFTALHYIPLHWRAPWKDKNSVKKLDLVAPLVADPLQWNFITRQNPPKHVSPPFIAGIFNESCKFLIVLEPCSACLDLFGPVWTCLWHVGPIWTYLDQFGPICTGLDPFGPIWTPLDPFGLFWT